MPLTNYYLLPTASYLLHTTYRRLLCYFIFPGSNCEAHRLRHGCQFGGKRELASLHLTSPHLTSPRITSPHLTPPHLASPHYPPPTTHYSLLTTHYSLLATHNSLFTTHYSLLTTHYSLLTTLYSLPTTHYPLLTGYYCHSFQGSHPGYKCYLGSCCVVVGFVGMNYTWRSSRCTWQLYQPRAQPGETYVCCNYC